MRIVVDLNRCQAYAQCVLLAPEDFILHKSEESLLYNPQPDPSRREDILRAVHACPVQAIMVEFEAGEDRAAKQAMRGVHADDKRASL